MALAFWPWSLLAQPWPLPEQLLSAAPEAIVGNALTHWGTPATTFPQEVRSAYVDTLRDPARVHAICEEYRAAATLDRLHDEDDRKEGRMIGSPLLALWSSKGGLATWYEGQGGPVGVWKGWADEVDGVAMPGGHFFPEENPRETAQALLRFFAR